MSKCGQNYDRMARCTLEEVMSVSDVCGTYVAQICMRVTTHKTGKNRQSSMRSCRRYAER
eukprot:6184828-Pleurochrysis_carterae.AAC.4